MKVAGKTYEPVTYEGADTVSCAPGKPDTNEANKRAWDAAWKRWLEILTKL